MSTGVILEAWVQVAEEKFENKKAVQRKVIKQLRSEMAAQAPVVSKLHDKFKVPPQLMAGLDLRRPRLPRWHEAVFAAAHRQQLGGRLCCCDSFDRLACSMHAASIHQHTVWLAKTWR